jgi:hypothetical protein
MANDNTRFYYFLWWLPYKEDLSPFLLRLSFTIFVGQILLCGSPVGRLSSFRINFISRNNETMRNGLFRKNLHVSRNRKSEKFLCIVSRNRAACEILFRIVTFRETEDNVKFRFLTFRETTYSTIFPERKCFWKIASQNVSTGKFVTDRKILS